MSRKKLTVLGKREGATDTQLIYETGSHNPAQTGLELSILRSARIVSMHRHTWLVPSLYDGVTFQ
jgi:hypothetical protein